MPVGKKTIELREVGNLWHIGDATLLGCFGGMRLKPVAADTLGVGERGLHGAYPRNPHFNGFLDDEIRPRLLDRRKQKPEIGGRALPGHLLQTLENAAALPSLRNRDPPFAIRTVEDGQTVARSKAHHPEKVMRLLTRQSNRLPFPKRVIYIKPDFRVFHARKHMTGTDRIPETGQVADAVSGNWVDRRAPAWTRPYLRLSRADRPIGTWLLLLPCWWGLAIAALAEGRFGLAELWIGVGCAIGAWLMRGAGCTWNDITDRNFDGEVARTRSRPIPSGQVTVMQAVVWMVIQSLIAFCILLTFNLNAILLGIASLAIVCIYPFAKRFTWWPQVFLGLAFNWGALLAWTAVTGTLALPAVLLYVAGIAWTLFYDTIYAHQDKEDDALIGVKSTARLFGDATGRWLKWFLVASVSLFGAALILALAEKVNVLQLVVALVGVWAFGWHMAWQIRQLDIDDPDRCLALFRANRDAGLIPLLFLAVAHFL